MGQYLLSLCHTIVFSIILLLKSHTECDGLVCFTHLLQHISILLVLVYFDAIGRSLPL